MITLEAKGYNNRAAILYNLIGEHLPAEVFSRLNKRELEKLMNKLSTLKSPSSGEEKDVLYSFTQALKNQFPKNSQKLQQDSSVHLGESLAKEIEKLLAEAQKNENVVQDLKYKTRDELDKIIKDESPRTVALVLCFANPDEASKLLEDFHEKVREDIINEIHKIDFHSEIVRNELERFLNFKQELIRSNLLVSKIKNRGGRKAAEILIRLSPNISYKLLSKIQEKNPQFAEYINEHFYTFNDLLHIGRSTLSKFFSTFHPIVLACALKGVENSTKEKLLERCEPWLSKSIILEMDSMGPISLAEIEEAQKGIIEQLHQFIDSGDIKLWKER